MARSALFSSSVLSSAASGTRLPTLQVTLGFVAACGGDREEWRCRWMRAAGMVNAEAPARPRYRSAAAAPEPPRPDLPRPAQLPLRPHRFIGRHAELTQLHANAGTPTVVVGPPGVGKTSFGLHYAHSLADDMTDGQLYADLAPLTGTAADADYVLEGFLHALGIPAEQLPATPDQRAGLFRSLLAERRLVVLLDNVRDERQVRPLLTESRNSVTLVLSRTPLLGLTGVRRIRLDLPPRADSIAMIRADLPERADADPRSATLLAELCGDLPLALDIALRKLVARPAMPLHRATVELMDVHRALDWLCIGDLSVRDSLESAFEEVSEPARVLLARIAGVPFRCDPEALMPHGGELAEELLDMGLLRRGDRPGTFRVEWLVRAFTRSFQESWDEATVPALRTVAPRDEIRLHVSQCGEGLHMRDLPWVV